jgi:RNase H-like domain found in reverse transcriptase/Reverse transcriptase (RNA-dependent DNA polymerase)
MSELMMDLEYVRTYIDDLLVITNGTFEDHLVKLNKVLKRLGDVGLQVKAKKSFFARYELEYLGFWITREGIKPVEKKITAMLNVKMPTTCKELRSFIGMINYYKDMWIGRSDILAPLSSMCGKTSTWEWTDVHQKSFDTIKRIMSQEVLLTYPDFSKNFDIHTDASKLQMGAVISQEGKPIAFYSRKLNDAQTQYTTTERELLAIVETLKEFKNILLGQKIRVSPNITTSGTCETKFTMYVRSAQRARRTRNPTSNLDIYQPKTIPRNICRGTNYASTLSAPTKSKSTRN